MMSGTGKGSILSLLIEDGATIERASNQAVISLNGGSAGTWNCAPCNAGPPPLGGAPMCVAPACNTAPDAAACLALGAGCSWGAGVCAAVACAPANLCPGCHYTYRCWNAVKYHYSWRPPCRYSSLG